MSERPPEGFAVTMNRKPIWLPVTDQNHKIIEITRQRQRNKNSWISLTWVATHVSNHRIIQRSKRRKSKAKTPESSQEVRKNYNQVKETKEVGSRGISRKLFTCSVECVRSTIESLRLRPLSISRSGYNDTFIDLLIIIYTH